MPSIPRALYAGSFDPVTSGHLYMIREGSRLFPELIVAVGTNPEKRYSFTVPERMRLLRKCLTGLDNVRVESFEGQFLIKFAESVGARYILRGIRNEHDYLFERGMRNVNADLCPGITTVFLMPPRDKAEVSSNFVKGLVGPKGWKEVVRPYLPEPIYRDFVRKFS